LRGGIFWDGSLTAFRYDVSLRSTSTQPAKTGETRRLLGKSLPIDPVQSPLPVRCTSRTCACHVCQLQLVSTPAPVVSNRRSTPRQLVSAPTGRGIPHSGRILWYNEPTRTTRLAGTNANHPRATERRSAVHAPDPRTHGSPIYDRPHSWRDPMAAALVGPSTTGTRAERRAPWSERATD